MMEVEIEETALFRWAKTTITAKATAYDGDATHHHSPQDHSFLYLWPQALTTKGIKQPRMTTVELIYAIAQDSVPPMLMVSALPSVMTIMSIHPSTFSLYRARTIMPITLNPATGAQMRLMVMVSMRNVPTRSVLITRIARYWY
jgi:hypothetical protein